MTLSEEDSTPDFIGLSFDEPLKQAGPWLLVDNGDDTQSFPLWRQAFESVFEFAALEIQEKWPLPADIQAHAVLSGDRTSQAWNGDSKAMGFHAILARKWEGDDEFLDLPEFHLCHVNLSAHQREAEDDFNDEAAVLAGLTTLPHEMVHVALFARHTNGKTPLQVFDEGGGEHALAQVLKELEKQAIEETGSASRYGGNEDVVEQFASRLVDRWRWKVPEAQELVGRLVESLAPRPAPKRRSGP